ncbi:MAG: hypothetical protein Q4A31_08890 [Corynebacterium sp.]|uniref:hypothetical protein n=1 Tax=Corynebacterium sp. TaxID=1720 RepID=UPI0026DD81A5|nr:hypothetical protein [Corynebacterium sp.]MDO4762019.1 hypothetical protein [Corynebacterium sp.]
MSSSAVTINVAALDESVSQLDEVFRRVDAVVTVAMNTKLSGAFSPVSGLHESAAQHGKVLVGGVGSAYRVLGVYRSQVEWLVDMLRLTSYGLTKQNVVHSRALDAGEGVGEEVVQFPPRPQRTFERFSFHLPFVATADSLDSLHAGLSATQNPDAHLAADAWVSLSDQMHRIATDLAAIADDLLTEHAGVVFENASTTILQVAEEGKVFAANALVVSSSVRRLAGIAPSLIAEVSAAQAAVKALPPEEQREAELEFLSQLRDRLAFACEQVDPLLRSLMEVAPHGASTHAAASASLGASGGHFVPQAAGTAIGGVTESGPRVGASAAAGGAGQVSGGTVTAAGTGSQGKSVLPAGIVRSTPVSSRKIVGSKKAGSGIGPMFGSVVKSPQQSSKDKAKDKAKGNSQPSQDSRKSAHRGIGSMHQVRNNNSGTRRFGQR